MEFISEESSNDVHLSTRCSKDKRNVIFETLLKHSVNGKVKYGSIKDVANVYSVSTRTVSRIWKKGIACVANGVPVDISLNLSGNVGRKRIAINPEDVARIPLNRRTTIRSMASALSMSKTSLHRRVKEGSLKSHSNAIKPMLTEENRKVRLQFCISMIDSSSSHNNPSFIDMYDRIHIDEKWFFLSRTSQKYYLLPEEDEPYRTCKSKKFITKVMFLCVVARPRFDLERNEMFDGKIGMFPFVYKEPAKRRSKNREAGTLETKPIESPPNSPDMNVLDLGFFRALQSLQHQEAPRNVDELVAATHKAFNEISVESLSNEIEISGGYEEYPWKRNFYKPSLVSIGPKYSKEVDQIKDSEYKNMYMKSFLERATEQPEEEEEYRKYLRNSEMKLMDIARSYYKEIGITCPHNDEELVEMLVLDGCFVVEFIIKCKEGGNGDPRNSVEGKKAREDMLMFENQLPFDVFSAIYKKMIGDTEEVPSFIRLVKFAFASLAPKFTINNFYDDNKPQQPMDLLHVVYSLCLPRNAQALISQVAEGNEENMWLKLNHMNSATELKEVGVRFNKIGQVFNMPKKYEKIPALKYRGGSSLFDITFL
nr:Transposase, Tc1-like protein [Ipomoea batatas]